jgi:hypothetical protein
MQKNAEKSKITSRGLVFRLFFDNPGFPFTVSQIKRRIMDDYSAHIDRKTIYNAINELSSINTGLSSEIRNIGPKSIPVKFYSFKK